jgi:hypothetical protein
MEYAGKALMEKFHRLARQGFLPPATPRKNSRPGRHVVLVVRALFASFWQGKDGHLRTLFY